MTRDHIRRKAYERMRGRLAFVISGFPGYDCKPYDVLLRLADALLECFSMSERNL